MFASCFTSSGNLRKKALNVRTDRGARIRLKCHEILKNNIFLMFKASACSNRDVSLTTSKSEVAVGLRAFQSSSINSINAKAFPF